MHTFLKLFVYPFLTIQLNSSMQMKLPKRFISFTFVGISGIVVNSAILYYAKEYLYVSIPIASLFAIQLAIFNNFFWNHRFTWTDREMKGYQAIRTGLIRFTLVSWIAGGLNWIILLLLHHYVGIHYILANLIAIFIASILNYFLNDLWTFRHPGSNEESES
ncbi:MAG: GtrA family protein [Candidatus Marinimicrobia bacterium]|nr:GtrA family protein [Candidatus Neomarinimicrobiota bacterium]MBT4947450.1 GtrA family protein [Candidatus Neomarinimicrobiota bacterium]MBT5270095.1 GtrA family protein [Candidatus Neomarinimicrobiota bacterium]MBT6012591.1 GtrA family protein [Candidatus Neomarinimicrobiota bacterium]